jgi:hypothetical protein
LVEPNKQQIRSKSLPYVSDFTGQNQNKKVIRFSGVKKQQKQFLL